MQISSIKCAQESRAEENGEGFRRALNETQSAAGGYQRGSRSPRPPDPLAFWRRYSA